MLVLKFDKDGLIPVVAQDYRTGEIRMFAWANEEAVKGQLKQVTPTTIQDQGAVCGKKVRHPVNFRR